MTLETLGEWTQAGCGPEQARWMLERWLGGLPVDPQDLPPQHRAPARVHERWPELRDRVEQRARIASRHPAPDGSERLLIELHDGQSVESVLLPRDGMCVSTQIGCAVGCQFCKTGESGLIRQLSADEILAQVALGARRRRELGLPPLRRVVLMGMGEPAHNLPNVLRALHHLGTEARFPHKQLVFSTVGDPRAFDVLREHSVKPALALSLHTLDDALRQRLLPRAPRRPARELLERALEYTDATRHPLQVQWTLLRDHNDALQHAAELIEALRGRYVAVNVIPWNHVEGQGFERPEWDTAVAFVRALKSGGVFATIRRSAGQEVDGGCGQLRARAEQRG